MARTSILNVHTLVRLNNVAFLSETSHSTYGSRSALLSQTSTIYALKALKTKLIFLSIIVKFLAFEYACLAII